MTLNFKDNQTPTLLGIVNGKKYKADMSVRWVPPIPSIYVWIISNNGALHCQLYRFFKWKLCILNLLASYQLHFFVPLQWKRQWEHSKCWLVSQHVYGFRTITSARTLLLSKELRWKQNRLSCTEMPVKRWELENYSGKTRSRKMRELANTCSCSFVVTWLSRLESAEHTTQHKSRWSMVQRGSQF